MYRPEEQVLDETLVPSNSSPKQSADGAIAPVYGRLYDLFNHTNYFALQEISTDEAILPYRGGTDWGDNGIYIALHQHEYINTDPNLRNTWTFINEGIAKSLVAMSDLSKIPTRMRQRTWQRRGYEAFIRCSRSICSGLFLQRKN